MRKEEIFEAIGDINEEYIYDAHRTATRKPRPTWVKWTAVAACLCLIATGAVVGYNISQSLKAAVTEQAYEVTASRVAWTDDPSVFDGALNKGKLNNENKTQFPVFKVDTQQDFEQFKTQYGEIFSIYESYGGGLSFADTVAKAQYNEGFFEENSLLIVYVTADSNSATVSIHDVRVSNENVYVNIDVTNNLETAENDIAGWLITITAWDGDIKDCIEFDVV